MVWLNSREMCWIISTHFFFYINKK
jgi:hypothetical protein